MTDDTMVDECEYGDVCQELRERLWALSEGDKVQWWGIYGSYHKAAHDILTMLFDMGYAVTPDG